MLFHSTDYSIFRCLVLLCLICFSLHTKGQIQIQELKNLQPNVAYTNIHSIPVYDDINMTANLIFIKKAVRKHMHKNHTETVFILQGKALFYLNGEEMIIHKGDQIVIPPQTSHAVIVKSKKPLKVLSIQSPQFKGGDRIFLD